MPSIMISLVFYGQCIVRNTFFRFAAAADVHVCLAADRNIPVRQRRGAILIIGMLAVAKRNVVTDRVDTLLKIGLGPVGKVTLPAYIPKSF
jgi:hypothetical protein